MYGWFQNWLTLVDLRDINLDNDIDTIINSLTSVLVNVANKTISQTKSIPTHTPLPWWSQECQAAVNERKKNSKKV